MDEVLERERPRERPYAWALASIALALLSTALMILWVRASPERVLIGLAGRHDERGGGERLADCLDCHVPFIGTPGSRCLSPGCHGALATGAPPREGKAMPIRFHVALGNTACGECHVEHSAASAEARPFTHALVPDAIRNECARCHSGSRVPGHLRTNALGCELCHGTERWTGAMIDHGKVLGHSCEACHEAPKTPAHATAAPLCTDCHATDRWTK